MKKLAALSILFFLFTSIAVAAPYRYHRSYRVHTHRSVIIKPARVVVERPSGYVDINSNVKDAKVFVNGKLAGTAGQYDGFPGKLKLRPGAYTIKVSHAGKAVSHKVRVTADGEVDVNVTF